MQFQKQNSVKWEILLNNVSCSLTIMEIQVVETIVFKALSSCFSYSSYLNIGCIFAGFIHIHAPVPVITTAIVNLVTALYRHFIN